MPSTDKVIAAVTAPKTAVARIASGGPSLDGKKPPKALF